MLSQLSIARGHLARCLRLCVRESGCFGASNWRTFVSRRSWRHSGRRACRRVAEMHEPAHNVALGLEPIVMGRAFRLITRIYRDEVAAAAPEWRREAPEGAIQFIGVATRLRLRGFGRHNTWGQQRLCHSRPNPGALPALSKHISATRAVGARQEVAHAQIGRLRR
eukprot:6648679-Prymnesium_polylepis.1